MAETLLATGSQKQVWMNSYFMEYIRDTRFAPYMSNGELNKGGIILARYELQEEAGKTINIPFIGKLRGSGVTGAQVLVGNEEELTNYNMPISVDWRRNGVVIPKSSSFATEINLLNAARDALKDWESEALRDDIIKAFASVITDNNGTTVNFDAATAGQKNTWVTNNADRVLFGNAISNYSTTFATAAALVDTTNDRATVASANLAKRMMKVTNPKIRPFKTNATKGREWFVAFHGSRSFRDIAADTTMVTANTQARAREGNGMEDNPIFQDGDLIYNGIIHREVPEIDDYCAAAGFNGIGTAGADVRPVFMSGAGAIGVAWGQEPTPRTEMDRDYKFRPGVAIEELLGVKKINYQGKQNGLLTWFVSAPADV